MFGRNPFLMNRRQPAVIKEKQLEEKGERGENVEEMRAGTVQNVQLTGIYPQPRLAQAYVIWQQYGPGFSPAEALEKGTLFPELHSPYPY